jgi:hypothetical protein
MIRFLFALLALPVLAGSIAATGASSPARVAGSATSASTLKPALVQDARTGSDPIVGGPTSGGPDSIQDYIQPDTEI